MHKFLYALVCLTLMGCASSMRVEDFSSVEPNFDLENFFNGKLTGRGVFYDRFGKVRARFTLDLSGELVAGELKLKEILKYSDGSSLERNYQFKKLADRNYQATANGIVGIASIVESGNALRWNYRLEQQIGKRIWILKFDDWMFRLSDNLVLNRAYAYKWGILVGEVIMIVEKNKPEIS